MANKLVIFADTQEKPLPLSITNAVKAYAKMVYDSFERKVWEQLVISMKYSEHTKRKLIKDTMAMAIDNLKLIELFIPGRYERDDIKEQLYGCWNIIARCYDLQEILNLFREIGYLNEINWLVKHKRDTRTEGYQKWKKELLRKNKRFEKGIENFKKYLMGNGFLYPPIGFDKLFNAVSKLEELHGAEASKMQEIGSYFSSTKPLFISVDNESLSSENCEEFNRILNKIYRGRRINKNLDLSKIIWQHLYLRFGYRFGKMEQDTCVMALANAYIAHRQTGKNTTSCRSLLTIDTFRDYIKQAKGEVCQEEAVKALNIKIYFYSRRANK
ncbi:MAG: hypothetical protein LBJ75_02465 [Puniceicoccales bacterium]|nr:hypothetical protein [Puniceicoccales bacterium]